MNITRELYPEERQQDILRVISQEGRVAVAELSRKYGVSEVTIRGDLQSLAEQGLIVRTHGGAVTVPQSADLSLNLRRQQQIAEKERIGVGASSFVSDGDAIFLDTSSTSLAIVRHLKQRRELTILTNSLAIAQAVLDMNGVTLVMTGGVLRRDTVSLIGLDGMNVLSKYNIKTGFFGAHGLTIEDGLTDVSVGEAEVKSQVVTMCRQVIAVLDSTKWGRVGPASFARVVDLTVVVTDQQAPDELMDQVRVFGTRVMQV
jgi:DeoR family transcriptional regulator, aga operon transcriptional repressor